MARIQARACASRALVSDYSQSSDEASQTHRPGIASRGKHDMQQRSYSSTHRGFTTQECQSSGPVDLPWGSGDVVTASAPVAVQDPQPLAAECAPLAIEGPTVIDLVPVVTEGPPAAQSTQASHRWMEEHAWNNYENSNLKDRGADDEKSDKILEIDT
nr:protein IQ-DOMAIN 14-like [Ipomoea batatas]